jgi:predicted dehydrogenase
VGSGWRAQFFLRLAYLMPERFDVTGVVTRSAERGDQVTSEWGIATFRSVPELLAAESADFVIASVPWDSTPEVIRELVASDVPVLAETPPAPDADGLRSLWRDLGASQLVQVAEQYPLMPRHAARIALVDDGLIGQPTSVQTSSTHLYHAIALIRRYLGVASEPAEIRAQKFTAPLANPITPDGWTGDATPQPLDTTIATIDFGTRMGLYDFTDNQWWNPLRNDRLTVRGSTGEIIDDRVVRMVDATTPLTSTVIPHYTGVGLNLEGFDLTHIGFDGRVIYRNPYEGARLADDDIAVAALLDQMGAWTRGEGPPPYPLANGCQDHLIALAITQSSDSGRPVRVNTQPWSGQVT